MRRLSVAVRCMTLKDAHISLISYNHGYIIVQVITNEEAERRGKVYDAEGRTYLFDLDYDDGDCHFTVDAGYYGNVAHFINHSVSRQRLGHSTETVIPSDQLMDHPQKPPDHFWP